MSALEMMMKSFGIDPEAIKKQVENAGQDFKNVVETFENKFENLKKNFERLENKIDLLLEGKEHKIEASTDEAKK